MTTDGFALHFLLHSAALVEEELRKRLARIEVRPRQARVLDALARMGPTSQVSLAREFRITPASMSTMTARLIDGGYITREIDPSEARSNILRLTSLGQDLLSEIHAAWHDVDALIAARLGASGAASLKTLTRTLRDELGGFAPGRPSASGGSTSLEINT